MLLTPLELLNGQLRTKWGYELLAFSARKCRCVGPSAYFIYNNYEFQDNESFCAGVGNGEAVQTIPVTVPHHEASQRVIVCCQPRSERRDSVN